MKTCLAIILLSVVFPVAAANTWFVDNTASGANNGTSWANAWTSLSSASGASVVAGDTVYISGGSTSQTYSGTFSPKSGSSGGGRITYQIGQDAGHNGTVIFSTSGTWIGPISYCNILGNVAGDTNKHFSVTGINQAYSGNFSNIRIAYVDFGSVNATVYFWNFFTGSFLELDHCFWKITGTTCAKGLLVNNFSGVTWDESIIHDNWSYVPHGSDPAIGCDGSASGSTAANTGGYTLSNNVFVAYAAATANGTEHADGWQCSGGSYIKLLNNTILGFGDIGIYGGGLWGVNAFNNVVYANNIVDSLGHNAAGCVVVESDNGFSGQMTNILIFNNIGRSDNTSADPIRFYPNGPGVTTSGNFWSNNIAITSLGGYSVNGTTITGGKNLIFTDAQAANQFINFVAGSTNSNYHLKATASTLIGQGANLSGVFNYDRDAAIRAGSGAWDIGPYAFVAGDSTAPTLSSATIPAAGNVLNLVFSEIVTFGAGGNGGWTFTMSGGAVTATYSSGSGSSALVYSLSRTVGIGETKTAGLAYAQPGNGVEDASGNDLATISGNTVVNNSTADITVPTLSSATIPSAGNVINLVFSETVKFGAGGTAGWAFTMSGGAVTAVYSSGSNSSTLVYSLSRVVNAGETKTVGLNYTQPGNGIEDTAGNDLATVVNAIVSNNSTQDTVAPTLVTATIPAAGNVINLVFSEAVTIGLGGNAGWSLTMSGGSVTMTYSSGAGTSTLVYTLDRIVSLNETKTSGLNYTQPLNGIEDVGNANDLVSISGSPVINNSTRSALAVATSGRVVLSGYVKAQ
jgi:hypothetical protein